MSAPIKPIVICFNIGLINAYIPLSLSIGAVLAPYLVIDYIYLTSKAEYCMTGQQQPYCDIITLYMLKSTSYYYKTCCYHRLDE